MKRANVWWVVLLATGVCQAQEVSSRHRLLAEGGAKQSQGDFDGAIADYSKYIAQYPDDADGYLSRANAKSDKGDFDGAMADCAKAIELKPDDEEAYESRAGVKHEHGDFDGAIADDTKAMDMRPDSPMPYFNRATSKMAKYDFDGAITDLNKAIELRGYDATDYYTRGSAKVGKGDSAGALADFNKAIAIDPKNAPAYFGRGCLHYDQQQWKGALDDFQKALEGSPGFDGIRYRIWLTQGRLGQVEAATKALRDFMKTRGAAGPDDWEMKVGDYLSGDLTEADLLKGATHTNKIQEAQRHCEAYFYMGEKLLIQGNKAGAAADLEKCVATGRKNSEEYQSAVADLKQLKAK